MLFSALIKNNLVLGVLPIGQERPPAHALMAPVSDVGDVGDPRGAMRGDRQACIMVEGGGWPVHACMAPVSDVGDEGDPRGAMQVGCVKRIRLVFVASI